MADDAASNPGALGELWRVFWDGTRGWGAAVVSFVTGGGAGAWTLTQVQDADGQRLPVKAIGPTGALADAHLSLTTGGTSQQLLAGAVRRLLWIWNPIQNNEPLYVNFGAAAALDHTSIVLEPGAIMRMESPGFVSSDAVNFNAASNGHTVGCKWA